MLGIGGLTSHSSRCRFAARLNSGVRRSVIDILKGVRMQKARLGSYLLAAAAGCFAPTVEAATWYGMDVISDDSMYFFDADTVERSPGAVVVWVKTVRISSADRHGAWSTAFRWRVNCSARTIQILAFSDYDNSGKFIRSINNPGTASPVYPDSTGEGVLKIACESNFPNDPSPDKYWKLASNDIFEARDAYVRYQNSQIDTAPN